MLRFFGFRKPPTRLVDNYFVNICKFIEFYGKILMGGNDDL